MGPAWCIHEGPPLPLPSFGPCSHICRTVVRTLAFIPLFPAGKGGNGQASGISLPTLLLELIVWHVRKHFPSWFHQRSRSKRERGQGSSGRDHVSLPQTTECLAPEPWPQAWASAKIAMSGKASLRVLF